MSRVLELGGYIAPAYAGMLLAEQGFPVEKWVGPDDPVLHLRQGDELWAWLNEGKRLENRHAHEVSGLVSSDFDIVLDNFRPDALTKWGIDPAKLAIQNGWVWVSLRSDTGGRSFDLIAQARSWMEYGTQVPFYLGDTAAGLWMAFKALAAQEPGHYPLGQASCLQKLVEGELRIDVPRKVGAQPFWDTEQYAVVGQQACVTFRGETVREPIRDRAWKLANLWHEEGRIRI